MAVLVTTMRMKMTMKLNSSYDLRQQRRSADARVDLVEAHKGERSREYKSEDDRVLQVLTTVSTPEECRCERSVEDRKVSTKAGILGECRCRGSTRIS